MDFKKMSVEELETRLAAIPDEIEQDGADLDALENEVRGIKAELEERKAEAAKKAEIRSAVASGAGTVVKTFEPEEKEEKKMYGIDTKEYRDAFMANLVGRATVEQRAILADNTAYGDGLSLPVGLDREIWDQVTTAHPILSDVDIYRTGMAIKVTKMTPAAITKKMDSAASSEQTFTSAEVTLVGADYHTYVEISYAEAKMSQGAMERFLVREVADAIGEALAKDIFARILSDAGNAQKVTPATGSTMFDNVKAAMALAVQARNPVIYAPATAYYDIVGAIASGSPFNIGATLGCAVKLDSAATKVTVLDPSMFVLNVIQDTMIESERNAKDAKFVIGGYMRAEGCLRKTAAAAYIN
jgi:HK97 family phage major capsid protein